MGKKVIDSSEGLFVWDNSTDKFWRYEIEASQFCTVNFSDQTFEEIKLDSPEEEHEQHNRPSDTQTP